MGRTDGRLSGVEVVLRLKADIASFQEEVSGILASIKSTADSMGESWKDSQYQEFKAYVDELSEKLNTNVSQLESAIAALEKEVI